MAEDEDPTMKELVSLRHGRLHDARFDRVHRYSSYHEYCPLWRLLSLQLGKKKKKKRRPILDPITGVVRPAGSVEQAPPTKSGGDGGEGEGVTGASAKKPSGESCLFQSEFTKCRLCFYR